MDFSRILDTWDRRNKGMDGARSEIPRDPRGGPSRREMEEASVERRLDLHGMTAEEAEDAVRQFLGDSRRQGLRKILVIHGRGLHSGGQRAVLREAVQVLFRKNRDVAAWCPAQKGEGGAGASWVWLREN